VVIDPSSHEYSLREVRDYNALRLSPALIPNSRLVDPPWSDREWYDRTKDNRKNRQVCRWGMQTSQILEFDPENLSVLADCYFQPEAWLWRESRSLSRFRSSRFGGHCEQGLIAGRRNAG
jgi:hypothetical protein